MMHFASDSETTMAERVNLKSLQIVVDGRTLRFLVDEDTYTNVVIHEDPEAIDALYARHLAREEVGPQSVEVAGAADNDVLAEENVSDDRCVNDGDDVPVLEEAEGSPVTTGESPSPKWAHESTLLLISLYSEMRHLFNDPRYKAYEVWKLISAKMVEKGYKFSGQECDKKWRNMKCSYKKIVDTNSKSGRGRSTWRYLDKMDEILAGDPAVTPLVVVSSGQEPVFSSQVVPPTRKRKSSTASVASSSTAPPEMPETEEADTPIRAVTPPTRSSTPSSEEGDTITMRRRRRNSGNREAPTWFLSFQEEGRRRFDEMVHMNRRSLEAQTARNATLDRIADAIVAQAQAQAQALAQAQRDNS